MNIHAARISRFGLSLFALIGCLSGCNPGGSNKYEEPPPQKVEVANPLQQDVIDYVEETGTTEPFETVEIRARVEGYLEEINFEPGQSNITPGYELFKIDQKPYNAIVTQAEAALKVAQAAAKDAAAKYARAKVLAPKGAMSEEEVMERGAAVEVANAQIEAAQANLEAAQLDLSYTVVRSPITGRVSKTLVDIGNLVGSNMTTHLATVINYDPIYASFNISETLLLELRARRDRAKRSQAGEQRRDIKLYMGLSDEEGYPHEGVLNYADLAVDPGSGTYRIRGVFPNPDFEILSGSFARIRIPVDMRKGALLVPESAIGADQEGRYVWIVENEEVERRGTTVGAKIGNMRVILTGLEPKDVVVVRGIQRVRPGSKVEPIKETLELPEELISNLERAAESVSEEAEEPEGKPSEAAPGKELQKSTGSPSDN